LLWPVRSAKKTSPVTCCQHWNKTRERPERTEKEREKKRKNPGSRYVGQGKVQTTVPTRTCDNADENENRGDEKEGEIGKGENANEGGYIFLVGRMNRRVVRK